MKTKSISQSTTVYRHLTIIPLMIVITFLFSFYRSVPAENELTGTWTGTRFEFNQTKGPDISAMINGGKALHIGGKLILEKDRHYLIRDPEGKVNGKGSWKMNGNSSFTTTDDGGETTVYQIVSLTGRKLVTRHKVGMTTPDGEVAGEITLTYSR